MLTLGWLLPRDEIIEPCESSKSRVILPDCILEPVVGMLVIKEKFQKVRHGVYAKEPDQGSREKRNIRVAPMDTGCSDGNVR